MTFEELAEKLASKKGEAPFRGTLLSFDPGKTTGYAVFRDLKLAEYGQLKTDELGPSFGLFMSMFHTHTPTICVAEDYRVYKHKQKQHAWSELHTAKLIGVLEGAVHADEHLDRLIKQPAFVAKGFCTDSKLQDWDMYVRGQKHARDAIRHGCYHLLFGGADSWHVKPKSNRQTIG